MDELNLNHLDPVITAADQWVVWNCAAGDKAPLMLSGIPGSTTDPMTWGSFADATRVAQQQGFGVGYVFRKGGGVCGIDLDDCFADDGSPMGWAQEVLDRFPSYTEYSPSRRGLHVLFLGDYQAEGKNRKVLGPHGEELGGVEFYGHGRYFTVTGWPFGEHACLTDCGAEIPWLLEQIAKLSKRPKKPQATHEVHVGNGVLRPGDDFASKTTWAEILEPHGWVLERAREAGSYWRRPGKERGTSATTDFCRGNNGQGLFYPFSSNAPPFEALRTYSKFGAYAALNHDGDHTAAAAALRDRGFGESEPVYPEVTMTVGGVPYDAAPSANGHVHVDEVEEIPEDYGSIPQEVLDRISGIMRLTFDWIMKTAHYPQAEYSLAAALALMSTITGRKIVSTKGVKTNLYVIVLGSGGSGKDHPQEAVSQILREAGADELLGTSAIKSSAGIYTQLDLHPCKLFVIDEIGDTFATIRAAGVKSSHLADIETTLKKLYGCRTGNYGGYADEKQNKLIVLPHLVLYGSGVPHTFWSAITPNKVKDGMIPRMLVFDCPRRGKANENDDYVPLPKELIEAVKKWHEWHPGTGNLASLDAVPLTVSCSETASQRLRDHRRDIDAKAVKEDENRASIWVRTAEKSWKLALLFACSRVLDPACQSLAIDLEDADLAVALSNWQTRQMVRSIYKEVGSNDRVRTIKRIVMMISKRPHSKTEIGRETRDITRAVRQEILDELVEQGTIILTRVASGGLKPIAMYSLSSRN